LKKKKKKKEGKKGKLSSFLAGEAETREPHPPPSQALHRGGHVMQADVSMLLH
jgi:hypothetical protein